MTYNIMAIEQWQARLAIEHKQRMIARQAEIDSGALALAEDGIRIALKIAGYENVDNMDQFERASALLDMAQELLATRKPDIDNDSDIRKAFVIAHNFGKVYKEVTA